MTDNIEQTNNETENQDLNDLLDSALQDFDKVSISNVEKSNDINTVDSQKQTDKHETSEDKWTEDFLKQTADQFEKNLQNLLQNDSELEAALQKLGQMSASNAVDEKDVNVDFQSAVSQVLKDLTANSENLQNETDMAGGAGEQTSLDGDTGDILPFMQGMMEHLLSKEILYPSLKELSDKYPAWLEEHKATLNASDLERYTKQSELMQKVCIELEKGKEDDAEGIKQHRFECVLKLMMEMQNYGQAPDDLVGEQCSPFQFDFESNPTFPFPPGVDSQQDCCIN
ncbi:LOW QUALITY PROTEIN: peroxisomal biogenesis factor 19 [Mycetomoellerius zeteki]|uniref:LOW QUALITY PROTEIN: peroxisomal biogenesis factor 19 n=1 Tax=Mycetomoellerius zeteki TaxID=64791 RepID=UPI00084EB579|nr:PREDICTED: LOW QUALITY PROTEIN: peroxisomal biogenesis factor 19 [Trachymyrmex zeteki]